MLFQVAIKKALRMACMINKYYKEAARNGEFMKKYQQCQALSFRRICRRNINYVY